MRNEDIAISDANWARRLEALEHIAEEDLALLERFADEAEAGYDVDEFKRRFAGGPAAAIPRHHDW